MGHLGKAGSDPQRLYMRDGMAERLLPAGPLCHLRSPAPCLLKSSWCTQKDSKLLSQKQNDSPGKLIRFIDKKAKAGSGDVLFPGWSTSLSKQKSKLQNLDKWSKLVSTPLMEIPLGPDKRWPPEQLLRGHVHFSSWVHCACFSSFTFYKGRA